MIINAFTANSKDSKARSLSSCKPVYVQNIRLANTDDVILIKQLLGCFFRALPLWILEKDVFFTSLCSKFWTDFYRMLYPHFIPRDCIKYKEIVGRKKKFYFGFKKTVPVKNVCTMEKLF